MKSEIRTAVLPVAGRGRRVLPATKASPKEMLPVVDKPLIQYAVEEALAAGAQRLVFITGASKRAIEDHFDSDQELEKLLESQGKTDLARQIRSVLPAYATCIYIRQSAADLDRKSTRLNSSHTMISYVVLCLLEHNIT